MTVVEFVHKVAAEFGETLTAGEAEHVLWGFTGYPSFWSSEGPPCDGTTTVEDSLGFELRRHFWERKFRRWLGLPPALDYCAKYLDEQPAEGGAP